MNLLEPGEGARGRWRAVAAMATAGFRADPWRAGGTLALDTLAGLSGPVFAVALGWLADAAQPGGVGPSPASAALVLAVALSALMALWGISWQLKLVLEEKTAHLVECHVVDLVTGLPGVAHHENPDHLRRVEQLIRENWLIAMSVPALVGSAEVFVRLAVTMVLLARVDTALLALPLFAVPSVVAGALAERIRLQAIDRRADIHRRGAYLFDLATQPAPAKEVRIFGLGPELLARHHAAGRDISRDERDHRLKGALLVTAGRLIFALGYAGAIIVVAARVAGGDASVGDLVLTLALAGQVMGQLTTISDRANWLNWTLTAVRNYLWLLDYAARATTAGRTAATDGPRPAPARLCDGIRFEGVGFRYADETGDVLRDVDLHLPAGAIVAVVGDNGAGKSTLVKLLCRLYEPTSGRITVDGVDLRDLDLAGWRQRATAAFQDAARFELVAAEAVGVGDPARMGRADVAAAVAGSGTGAMIDGLPAGLDTQLGPTWVGGVELSGGQWQQVAHARSLMPQQPVLLVLDEPTAALDADAEHALFERYAAAARAARSTTGAVTVLVSHRFSTVRMADLIVVLREGRVVEFGPHADLMAAGGLYAELYALQSRAYR
ncbi:MAG: ABC transporter ATP-binding protein [Acidimicrobiales bacterium]